MDVDNAAVGGTGKDQLPVDFNRDWDSPSYWPAVIAVKQKITQTNGLNPIKIFIDSHNPFPGQNDNNTWFYASQNSGVRSANLDFYRKLLLENGGYVFNRELLYATDGQTAQKWVDSVFNIDFSSTLETGWVNRTDNIEWTLPMYKTHGEVLGKGMCDYISNIISPSDIILDNTDTLNGVSITGVWFASTFFQGYWGINYLHDGNTSQGTKSVRYSPNIQQQGDYEIFLRWTAAGDRASNVPVRITHAGGVKDTLISQRARGSEWVAIGIYRFNQGSSASVLVSNTGTNGFVIADAVRFAPRNYCNPISVQHNQVPAEFLLWVYPNPFNPAANFNLKLPVRGFVTIKIYDLLGREIQTLAQSYYNPGNYTFRFDGSELSSGIYFYTASVESALPVTQYYTNSGKLVLIK
jgi:hypothetical protein